MKMFKNHLLFTPIVLLLSMTFFSCTKVVQKEENASLNEKTADNSKYFYYYKNKKRDLVLNTGYVHIVSKKTLTATYKDLGVVTSDTKSETVKKGLNQRNAPQIKEHYYGKLKLSKKVLQEEYLKTLDLIQGDPNIEFVSPFFDDPQGALMTVSQFFYVKLQTENDLQTLYNVADAYGASVVRRHESMPLWYMLSCTSASQSSLSLANAFYQTGLFTCAEPDFMFENILTCPADPRFPTQWGANNTGQRGGTAGIDIKACQAWDMTRTGAVIDVAVVDDSVDKTHEDLVSDLYGPMLSHDAKIIGGNVRFGDHGTNVAGVVGARENNKGITGVAPYCRLMPVSVPLGSGISPAIGFVLSEGIDWAWRNGAEVITCSWVFAPSTYIDDAVSNALYFGRDNKGCVVIFSVGNEGGTIQYPANSNPDILAVGAANPCGQRVTKGDCINDIWGSNFGSQLDVVAPGIRITTTGHPVAGSEPGYDPAVPYTQLFYGTSAAAPAVAGIAALILSKNPTLTGLEVRNIIESTAQKTGGYAYAAAPGRNNGTWQQEMGYGFVNAAAAVAATQRVDVMGMLYYGQIINGN